MYLFYEGKYKKGLELISDKRLLQRTLGAKLESEAQSLTPNS